MDRIKWLVINYTLPSKPSRHRVAIWRNLKKLGAVNIQQSMWVLPETDNNYNALHKIIQRIKGNNGDALLTESLFIQGEDEKRVVALFNKVRDEEYEDYINQCKKYLNDLKNRSKENLAAWESLKKMELRKLVVCYKNILYKDVFDASLAGKAREMLKQIYTS